MYESNSTVITVLINTKIDNDRLTFYRREKSQLGRSLNIPNAENRWSFATQKPINYNHQRGHKINLRFNHTVNFTYQMSIRGTGLLSVHFYLLNSIYRDVPYQPAVYCIPVKFTFSLVNTHEVKDNIITRFYCNGVGSKTTSFN